MFRGAASAKFHTTGARKMSVAAVATALMSSQASSRTSALKNLLAIKQDATESTAPKPPDETAQQVVSVWRSLTKKHASGRAQSAHVSCLAAEASYTSSPRPRPSTEPGRSRLRPKSGDLGSPWRLLTSQASQKAPQDNPA